jgi:uncharacterized protein (TIGR04255 family)
MTSQPVARLPEYDRPPVQELVIGCRFSPPQEIYLPHIGSYWSTIRAKYPLVEHKEPLSQPNNDLALDAATGAPLPRVWCLTADRAKILQIQVDGLILNWRRIDNAPYPRFGPLFAEFFEHLLSFEAHMRELGAGSIRPSFAELSYNNILTESPADTDPTKDAKAALACLGIRNIQNPPSLGDPRVVNWHMGFALPDLGGALNFKLTQGRRTSDAKIRTTLLEISALSPMSNRTVEQLKPWFDAAHVAIVRSFSEITDVGVQREIWGRHD